LGERRGDASDADWSIHGAIARQWEELTPEMRAITRRLDTTGIPEESVRHALNILCEFGLAAG
jgi:predicted kinase